MGKKRASDSRLSKTCTPHTAEPGNTCPQRPVDGIPGQHSPLYPLPVSKNAHSNEGDASPARNRGRHPDFGTLQFTPLALSKVVRRYSSSPTTACKLTVKELPSPEDTSQGAGLSIPPSQILEPRVRSASSPPSSFLHQDKLDDWNEEDLLPETPQHLQATHVDIENLLPCSFSPADDLDVITTLAAPPAQTCCAPPQGQIVLQNSALLCGISRKSLSEQCISSVSTKCVHACLPINACPPPELKSLYHDDKHTQEGCTGIAQQEPGNDAHILCGGRTTQGTLQLTAASSDLRCRVVEPCAEQCALDPSSMHQRMQGPKLQHCCGSTEKELTLMEASDCMDEGSQAADGRVSNCCVATASKAGHSMPASIAPSFSATASKHQACTNAQKAAGRSTSGCSEPSLQAQNTIAHSACRACETHVHAGEHVGDALQYRATGVHGAPVAINLQQHTSLGVTKASHSEGLFSEPRNQPDGASQCSSNSSTQNSGPIRPSEMREGQDCLADNAAHAGIKTSLPSPQSRSCIPSPMLQHHLERTRLAAVDSFLSCESHIGRGSDGAVPSRHPDAIVTAAVPGTLAQLTTQHLQASCCSQIPSPDLQGPRHARPKATSSQLSYFPHPSNGSQTHSIEPHAAPPHHASIGLAVVAASQGLTSVPVSPASSHAPTCESPSLLPMPARASQQPCSDPTRLATTPAPCQLKHHSTADGADLLSGAQFAVEARWSQEKRHSSTALMQRPPDITTPSGPSTSVLSMSENASNATLSPATMSLLHALQAVRAKERAAGVFYRGTYAWHNDVAKFALLWPSHKSGCISIRTLKFCWVCYIRAMFLVEINPTRTII
jgi:hypothetical protein